MKADVGDWVRFYRDGFLVIGVVNYKYTDSVHRTQLSTDVGVVSEDCILEVRKAWKGNEGKE